MSENADNVAIRVKNLSKTFKLPHEKHTSIKSLVISRFKSRRSFELQQALLDINFEVKKGEFFGIVGRNGSGKSTLLKCIAGVYNPSKGGVKINGSLVPFIELGVGFNPELSGRDNVFLNGALLGFNRKQMEAMYDEIVEFAELKKFMDQKLKNYSSGMQVRLAFSIAVKAEGDILLLDEVLAVGDSAFQQKCIDYFSSLKRNKKTIVLVTHSMAMVEKFCERAILIENSEIMKTGSGTDIAALYEDLFINDENKKKELIKQGGEFLERTDLKDISLEIIQSKKNVNTIKANINFCIKTKMVSRKLLEGINVGFNIRDDSDKIVFSTDTRKNIGEIKILPNKEVIIEVEIENYYTNGKYTVDMHIVEEGVEKSNLIYKKRKIKTFHIRGIIDHPHSLFHPKYKIRKT